MNKFFSKSFLFIVLALLYTACDSTGSTGPGQVDPDQGTCESMTCAKGCKDGQCIDYECAGPGTCPNEGVCVEGVCQPKGFKGCTTTCTRGVCNPESNTCVNDTICTQATESQRCLEDHVCVNETCVRSTEICKVLDCANKRGTCNKQERRCDNSNGCTESSDCLKGYYCNLGVCTPNACKADGTCDRGLCNETTGQCESAQTCSSSKECVDGTECIGSACVAKSDFCRDLCTGTRECTYDAGTKSAICKETTCTTAVDCNEGRVCDETNNTCGDAEACSQDAYTTTPIDFASKKDVNQRVKELKLCKGEKDTFSFRPEKAGAIVVTVERPSAEVGFGTLSVSLKKPDGTVAKTVVSKTTTGAPLKVITLDSTVEESDKDQDWTIEVESSDIHEGKVVNYTLGVDLASPEGIEVCQGSKELLFNKSGVTYDLSNSPPKGTLEACDKSSHWREHAFHFSLKEKSYIEIKADPNSILDVALALRNHCTTKTTEIACAGKIAIAGATEILKGVYEAGDYTLIVNGIVKGSSKFSDGIYMLSATSEPNVCEPGSHNTQECGPGNQSELVCNKKGTGWKSDPCVNECDTTTFRCRPPKGDSCDTAFVIDTNNRFEQTIDLNSLTNMYHEENTCGESAMGVKPVRKGRVEGHDLVFAVTLKPNETLFARATTPIFPGVAFYAVEDCTKLKSCLGSADFDRTNDPALLSYTHTGTGDKTFYLILDTNMYVGAEYKKHPKVEVWVGTPLCEKNTSKCIKEDSISITCNPLGDAYLDNVEHCPAGCNAATGKCKSPEGDTCQDAAIVTPGTEVSGVFEQYTKSTDLPKECSNLQYAHGNSNDQDAIFKVKIDSVPKVIEFTVTPENNQLNPMVWYAGTSCAADNKTLGCIVGSDEHRNNTDAETVRVLVEQKGDHYFVVQSGDTNGSPKKGDFKVSVALQDPAGVPYTIENSCEGSDQLAYYDHLGIKQLHTCSSNTCTDGKCVTPNGNSCLEPVVLDYSLGHGDVSSVSIDNSFNNNVEVPDHRVVDGCYLPKKTNGPDKVYQIDLKEGDLLEVDYDIRESIYIQEECGKPTSCVDGSFASGYGIKRPLRYLAKEDKTVYIVTDAEENRWYYSTKWTFNWKVTHLGVGVCGAPNFATYDNSTNKLAFCSVVGDTEYTATCANGSELRACKIDADSASVCLNGVPVTEAGLFYQDNSLLTRTTPPECANTGKGYIAYYKVHAPPGKAIRVSTDIIDGKPILFIAHDCADLNTSCVASLAPVPGAPGEIYTLTYLVPTGAPSDYIIGIDTSTYNGQGKFKVNIEVKDPECQENSSPACVSENRLKFCKNGYWDYFACDGTCTSGGSACDKPEGSVCVDAIPFDRTSSNSGQETYNSTNKNRVKNIDFGSGVSDGCLFNSDATPGGERIYKVDLNANETLEVVLEKHQRYDAMYLIESCDESPRCLVNALDSESTSKKQLVYVAKETKTYYLVIDTTSSSSTYNGERLIKWKVTPPPSAPPLSCVPGAHYCEDDSTLIVCNEDGTLRRVECPDTGTTGASCSNGFCNPHEDFDICENTPLLTGDFYGVIDPSQLESTREVSASGQCITRSSSQGPDSYYKLKLADKEKVTVTLERSSKDKGMIYIVKDCLDLNNSCLAFTSTDNNAGPFIDSLSYTAQGEETVYIGVKYYGGSGQAPAIVDIKRTTPNCTHGTSIVCNSDGNLEYCNSDGYTEVYECKGTSGCVDGNGTKPAACSSPRGESCFDPILFPISELTPSDTSVSAEDTKQFSSYSQSFNIPVGTPTCPQGGTPGKDYVYAFDLKADQTLSIEAVSTASTKEDIAIYLVKSCDELPLSCTASADKWPLSSSNKAEELEYTASADERVFLVVDSAQERARGGVKVKATITKN